MPVRRSVWMKAVGFVLAGLVSSAAGERAWAQEEPALKIGDPAPAIKVGKWVKGDAVNKFEPGTVYVVEFWATWCGPCVAAIPHVTELQKKHEGKVVVIGANIWEQDESLVEPFVQKMGDKMGYRVALDDKSSDNDGFMASNWMRAAGQNGIPCSFVVDGQGKIAWIGHPLGLAPVLEKVVAGNWDAAKEGASMSRREQFQTRLSTALRNRDVDAAVKVLDEAVQDEPSLADQATVMKFQIQLAGGKYDAAYATGDAVYKALADDAQGLNEIAWFIATEPSLKTRDLPLALKLATRAVEVSERKEASILDTLARVQFDSGDVKAAIDTQREAVGKAESADSKADLQATLDKYIKDGGAK